MSEQQSVQYCVWQHYYQSASAKEDKLFYESGVERKNAVDKIIEVYRSNNAENKLSDDDLRSQLDSDWASIDAGEFMLILVSNAGAQLQPGDSGVFELSNELAPDVSERECTFYQD